MLSIELLRERISELQKLEDFTAIKDEIKNIFHDIIYTGSDLFIAVSNGKPVFAPYFINGQEAGNFLRLFSHTEIAQTYLLKHEDQNIQKVSIVETIQLAKTYFINGGFGFILNEGDKWLNIPFGEYLEVFFERIHYNDEMFNRTCADVLVFLNELRYGELFSYNTFVQENKPVKVIGEFIIFSKYKDMSYVLEQNPDLQIQSIAINDLFDMESAALLCILSEEKVIKTSADFVQEGMKYLSLDKPDEADITDWHIKDISLVFNVEEQVVISNDVVENNNHSEDDIIAFGDEIPDSEEMQPSVSETVNSKLKVTKTNLFTAIKSFKIPRFKQDKKIEQVPENSVKEIHVIDEKEPDIIKTKIEPNLFIKYIKKTLSIKTFLIILLVFFAVLGIGMIGVQHNRAVKDFELFCSYVDNSEFGNAYTLYNEANLSKNADQYLEDKLDKLILSYVSDEIRTEEVKASIQSLSNFPSMQQEVEVARLTVSKLEGSKSAYESGNKNDSVYEKLDIWRQVIELDSINYSAVQETVQNNQLKYETELTDEIEYYSTRIKDFAKARYEVLAYWYPDSAITQEWSNKFSFDNSSFLSIYPVSIYNINIEQGLDSYWTLKLEWENKSVKTIKSIRFSLVALDEKGNILTCSDYQGKWTVFDAIDPHEYEHGEGSFNKDYKWNKAFYGSLVAAVKLTGIYIEYTDGSTASYTDEQDLLEMQQ